LSKRRLTHVGAVIWDLPRDDYVARWQIWHRLSGSDNRFSRAVRVHQSSFVAFNEVEIAEEFAEWLRSLGASVWLVNGSLTRVSSSRSKRRVRRKER